MDMSERVLANLAKSYENIRKGLGTVMGGKILDYEAKRIRNEGWNAGLNAGRDEGWNAGLNAGRNEGRNEGVIISYIQMYKQGECPGVKDLYQIVHDRLRWTAG